MKNTMKIDGVEAKKIRSFEGMDGVGYNAVLVIDGKPVADIFNEGSGGPTYLRGIKDRAAVEAFEAKVRALPPYTFPASDSGPALTIDKVDPDLFLGLLVEDAMEHDALVKLCKKSVVLRLPDAKSGDVLTSKRVLDDACRAWIKEKYPTAEVVNDTLGIMPTIKPAKARAR